MARKLRLWSCPCCRRSWRRKKKDNKGFQCSMCQIETIKRRTYPQSRKNQCKHQRERNKFFEYQEKILPRVRKANGHIFRPSKELKQLWRLCRRAKTRPSLHRKAEKFLELINKEIQEGEGFLKR